MSGDARQVIYKTVSRRRTEPSLRQREAMARAEMNEHYVSTLHLRQPQGLEKPPSQLTLVVAILTAPIISELVKALLHYLKI